jgi:hypothetical protein
MPTGDSLATLRAMIAIPAAVTSGSWVTEALGDQSADDWLPGPTDALLLARLEIADDHGWDAVQAMLGPPRGEESIVLDRDAAKALGLSEPRGERVTISGPAYDPAPLYLGPYRPSTAIRVGAALLVSAVTA